MIQIYKPGNENFSKNGDAVLQCFHCEVTAELNGTWVLNAEVPLDNDGRWKLVTKEAVLKVPTWQDDEQLYRISQVTETEDGVSMIAYPIFYDSANDCFLLDCRPTGKQAQEALNIMMAGSPYSGETNITAASTAYFVRRNLLDAICGNTSPTFIERWGGEILYDNYKIIINDRVGGDYGVEARYGRNIEGVTYVVDGTDITTRIVPVAYNGHMMSGSEPWVDSEYINSYAKVYTKEIHYENIRMAADAGSGDDDGLIICNTQAELDAALQAAAEADFTSGMDAAKVTIDVDMAIVKSMASLYSEELLDSSGDIIQDNTGQDILAVWYRDYANLETVRLGDTIRCRHSRLDITSTARVISLTWDCCLKKVSHVTLGDYSYNYVKNITNAINRVAGITRDDGTLIAEKVQGFLDGAQTQLRTQYNLATKQDVLAILFENLDEDSPMYGALGIGTQGICISKTRTADGRDWDWTTGITANGVNASMGVFGILADKLGKNWINLDTGEFRISGETLIGGKTIEGYMSEAEEALAEYATATDATIAGIQAQIDGQYTTYFENYTPTLANLPASDWTTDALKSQHEGDLFYNKADGSSYRFFKNNGVWEWTLITDTVATQALALANKAKDTADGKRRVFTVQPVPPYDVGDIYFDGDKILVCMTAKASGTAYQATDFVKRDAYTDNQTFGDFVDAYNQTISGIQSDLDDRIETWSQSADPSTSWTEAEQASHAGDLWMDTNTGVTRYWTGTEWTEFTTNPPASVIGSINSKATIFTGQPTPPYRVGDLWFDSLSADIMTCMTQRLTGNFNAGDWEKRNKYTDDSELESFINGDFAEVKESLQSQVDAKIESWYQNTDPALAWTGHATEALQDHNGDNILDENSEIITAEYESDKVKHEGDIWYNTTDGTQWRYHLGEWEEIDVPAVLWDTVDSKKTIYSAQPTPPYAVNDLWVQGETGDILVCQTGRESGSFNADDWILASKYTDDSALTTFINGNYKQTIEELKEQADGKAETWYQATDPSTTWDDPAIHKGDLWYNTTDQTTWFWDGTAWQQQNVPTAVFDKIDTKAQIFATQPTVPYHVNDLWYTGTVVKVCKTTRTTGTFNEADWAKKDYYTDDSALTNFIDNEFASLQAETGKKVETWYQSSDPATAWTTEALRTEHTGDIWYNTSANVQKTYRYTGTAWKELTADPPKAVFDSIDGKATIYVGATTPTSPSEGDLWMKSANDDILTYVSGSWQKYNKYTDDTGLANWISTEYAQDLREIESLADGKIESWYQEADPAADWTTDVKEKHKGDIWQNTATQKTYRYTGTAWQEMTTTPPDEVFDKIDTKAQIFAVQPTIPYYKNDLWYTGTVVKVCTTTRTTGSFTASDWVKKDYYTDDSALQAFIEGDFAETLAEVQNQIDGKIQTWYQATDPSLSWTGKEETVLQDHTGADILDESDDQITTPLEVEKIEHIGDIWHNSADNTQWRWNGGGWYPMSVPDELLDTLDGKSAVYVGPATPSNPEERDLWFKGAGEPILTFVSGAWVEYNKYTSDENLYDFVDNTYGPAIEDIQEQLDGKIELFFYEYVPTLANIPASEWTTTEEKDKHVGDLFYNTAGGNEASYRFEYDSETKVYQWVRIKNADIDKALSDASKAQDTADNKRRVFTTQPKPPYDVGDMWVQGASGDIMVCKIARASGNYSASDFQRASKYTDDSAFANWMENTYTSAMQSVNDQLDQKIQTWYQGTNPATSWTTETAKSEHVGDVWQNTSTGRTYIYTSSTSGETTTYAWNEITTTPPAAVQNTIATKKQVFVGESTPTPPYAVGDLWITGSATTGAMRYCSTARSSGSGQIADWSLTPTETKAQATINALNGEVIAKVVAGNIINAINISKEGIKIDATNLNINGIVSANNYFKILTDGSFETIKGKIGQINIVENAIYSGNHNTVTSASTGFILNKDGEFSVGDANQYIRYRKDASGKYVAEIKVNYLTIAGEAAPTAADIRGITGSINSVSSVASGAATSASNAQSTANSASTAAATAQTTAENAAKTATNFLYWDSTNGLIVSETGSASGITAKPYNTQIAGTGINFRSGTKVLGSINGTAITLYKPSSNNVKSMELLSNGLYFYKSDGTTVTSKFTDVGLEIATGTIGGFTIDAKSMYTGTLGQENSAFVSSGTTAKAVIAGSPEKAGWLFTASNTFGVNKDGNVYFNKGLIGNIVIEANSIHTNRKNTATNNTNGFYLGANGDFSLGDNNSYLRWVSTKEEGESAASYKLIARVTQLYIGGTDADTRIKNAQSTADTAKTNAAAAQSTADTAKTNAATAQSTADTAKTNAATAQTTANSAKTAAESAKTKATNAFDKAQYLSYTSGTGLIMTTNPSNPQTGFYTQIASNGIFLRYNTQTKLGITTASIAMYSTSGTTEYKAMELTSTKLSFKRFKDNAAQEVAYIGTDGLCVTEGTIGGFTATTSSNTGTTSEGGHIFRYSLYTHFSTTDGGDYEVGLNSAKGSTAISDKVLYVGIVNHNAKWQSANISYSFYITRAGDMRCKNLTASGVTTNTFDCNTYANFDTYQVYFNNLTNNDGEYILKLVSSNVKRVVAYRSGSSIRYKTVDRKLTTEDIKSAYDIDVVWAKYKPGFLGEGDPWEGKLLPMFVAEDVDDKFPEAAKRIDGKITDWHERIMIPVHHQMLKDQKDRIEALEAEVAKLKEALRHSA